MSATFIVSITFRREPKRHYINFGELVCQRVGCRRVGLSASWFVGELSINHLGNAEGRCYKHSLGFLFDSKFTVHSLRPNPDKPDNYLASQSDKDFFDSVTSIIQILD